MYGDKLSVRDNFSVPVFLEFSVCYVLQPLCVFYVWKQNLEWLNDICKVVWLSASTPGVPFRATHLTAKAPKSPCSFLGEFESWQQGKRNLSI